MKRSATLSPLNSLQPKLSETSSLLRRSRKTVSPRESTIRNLLNYSKALTVLKTTEGGYINLVMN